MMHARWRNLLGVFWLWLGLLDGPTGGALGADSFVWKAKQNKVDAQIEASYLRTVLGRIAASTGWQIFVEPETEHVVSVKFKDLPAGEALRRLLGDLNFALLPQTNAATKLFIYRTSVQEATQLIPAVEDPKPKATSSKLIPNELVVTLKPGSKEGIEALARRLGAKVIGSADDLKSYRLQFTDEAAADVARETLAADKGSIDVDSNYAIGSPTRTEGLQLSSPPPFNLKPKVSTDASKIIVGLIDMPVQSLTPGMNEFLLPSIQVAGESAKADGQLSHGTSMAETILQGLSLSSQENGGSSVRILPVDVYGSSPETTTFDVAKGIYSAINAGATIINLSMGGDGDSKMLANLIQESYKSGVLFFGAAGNQPATTPTYPAAYAEVVAVTAGDKKGNIAPYANRGNFVDVIAPGLSVVQYNGQSFLVSGTSAATAYVTGTAAAYRATGKPSAQVEAAIREGLAIKPPGGAAATKR
jgi:hypothetical protein